MKLSILICHLNSRKALLERLMAELQPQVDAFSGQVEVVVEADDGGISTGTKRNNLLDRAQAKFIAFFDDDDLPSPDYCSKIIGAIDSTPDADCVKFEGLIYNNTPPRTFIHSLKYRTWFEEGGVYFRPPNHLSPVLRELALKTRFPSLTIGEDRDYSMRLLPLLKVEAPTEGVLYHYYP